MAPRKTKRDRANQLASFVLLDSDRAVIAGLMRRLGIRNRSDLLRMALKRWADAEGLSLPEPQQLAATGTDG